MNSALVVDQDGLLLGPDLTEAGDRPLDLYFDEQRIGSFWSERDTRRADAGRRWPWPPALQSYLDGSTRIRLVDHLTEEELADVEVRLGAGTDRISVADKHGNPLGLDKSLRLMRLFGTRSKEHLEPLLDSIDQVLGVLREVGLEPFLAYGTLLGAVRDGAFIGHDSDADIGYVSRHEHPADATLESFAVQRALVERGYRITRYSGLAFKIMVPESDGTMRGLDVFGGFLRDDVLYLMGEVGHRFQRSWLTPLSTASLEGRDFAVPAHPEHLLEAMYGPGWKVPDPAYKFTTPEATVRRLNGWFRGTRVNRESVWDPFYSRSGKSDIPRASDFVAWVLDREPDAGRYLDVGCGFGSDVMFAARRGVPAVGLDYSRRAFARRARQSLRQGLPATFAWLNLNELRSVLPTATLVALDRPRDAEPGHTVVAARHILDATNAEGRDNLLRFARIAGGPDTVLYAEFMTEALADRPRGTHALDVDRLTALVQASGARVDLTERLPAGRCRMVVRWDR